MAKRKLKKQFKIILVGIIILFMLTLYGIDRYKVYKYHQTYEYKLLTIGYDKETTSKLIKKLDNNRLDNLLNSEKKDYIINILEEKYYLDKNYDKYISYYESNTDKSFSDVIALVNVGATKAWYEDIVDADTTNKYSMLVNKFHLLTPEYDPGTIKKFSSTYAYGSYLYGAEETCYNQYIAMANAAKKAGYTLIVNDGYRTYEEQKKTYEKYLKSRGQVYADGYAARAGASEHETGLALDIVEYGSKVAFDESDAFKWLEDNAQDYGFILRYPKDKDYITGYKYESWHYRYIGVDLARKVKKEGITYDEYYAYYLDK